MYLKRPGGVALPFSTVGPCQYLMSESLQKNRILNVSITAQEEVNI